MSKTTIQGAQPFPMEAVAATPQPATTPHNAPASSSFSLLDILSIPLQESATVTKTFESRGRKWPITVKTDALNDPQEFFALSTLMSEGRKTRSVRIEVDATHPFTLTNGQYIGGLNLLARVVVSPSLGFDEWAEFGRRVGGSVIASIINFALEVNGYTDEAIQAEEASAGE